MDFWTFLENRGVSDEHIQNMKLDKIDEATIEDLDDDSLSRSTLLDEMIGQFKDSRIMTYNLKYSIIEEKGADEDGVSRDVYSGFWSEFFDHAAEVEDMRVPSLSAKWQDED
ncbi:uncharacterized protein LOC117263136 [Tachysurus ichikawai]